MPFLDTLILDFRHSSDEEIQHGFADAKVCEHYS